MRLTLAEPSLLKDSISIISELVNEARFKITKNGIELVAMDPANVAMVIFKLLASTFTEYNVTSDTEIAINLSHLKMILKRASSNDMLTLDFGDSGKLKILLSGKTKREFSIPIIDLEEREQRVPELSFSAKITMPSGHFNSIIDDVDIVAESVTLETTDNKFKVSAEGDLSKANIEIMPDDTTKIITDSSKDIKAKYSIEYLKKMIGGSKLADTTIVQFSQDYPLRIDYTKVDRVALSFVLAPRVEND